MRFFFAFLSCFLFYPIFSQAQEENSKKPSTELVGDTIEGTSTDTSIIYIIKKPPVTLKEKIEVQREKKKRFFYVTIGISTFINANNYKARSGYKEYTNALNTATRSRPGFTCLFQAYHVPKKNNIVGISVEGKRIEEVFHFNPVNGEPANFSNSYTYGNVSVLLGKWYRKGEKISYQLLAYPIINYRFAVSGYTLSKSDDYSSISYIAESIAYKRFNLSLFMTGKILYQTKYSFIEAGPYIYIEPFSMTKKSEAFEIRRSSVGLYLTLTNKMF